MSGDDAIEPIGADRPVEPVTPRAAPVPPRVERPREQVVRGDGLVGADVEHEQIDHPIHEPRTVERRAAVHDAAVHGNAIAAAIERAHTADPSDRAEHLAGAAASAGSGQATPDEPVPAPSEHEERVDPLAPIPPVDDEPDRKRRN